MRTAVAVLLLASATGAQIQVVPVPFTPTEVEGFESTTSGFTQCIQGRVFNNKGDFCNPVGSGLNVTGGWGFQCSLSPYAGSSLCGSYEGAPAPNDIVLDTPVSKFGGYFAINSGVPDGYAEFYDAQGNLLASMPITAPASCTWTWNGWEATTSAGIKKVSLFSNYTGGYYLMMDDLQIDEAPPLDLVGTPDQVSVASGGSQVLAMDVGVGHASKTYQVLGSLTGTTPGLTYQGVNVPLNFDPYWNFTFLNPNTPILNGSAGVLNSLGQATAVFSLPPVSDPALVGLTVDHAGIVLDIVGATIQLVHATNAYPVQLIP